MDGGKDENITLPEDSLRSDYKNAPYSSKFPQANQTNYCWAAYVQHKICVAKKGEDDKDCMLNKAMYTTLCPSSWIETWDEQVEANLFPGQRLWKTSTQH
eukprot:TRINITY_DN3927_c0_g1_i1.p2 TRINITY_DN3927_c0_g1~~TRINITY_DN3927_c0_g1_i1.p2  ORF type:complete len:100 (+),score=20.76 TRINITY_DN3927_c0_g1_i1:34-333(+)